MNHMYIFDCPKLASESGQKKGHIWELIRKNFELSFRNFNIFRGKRPPDVWALPAEHSIMSSRKFQALLFVVGIAGFVLFPSCKKNNSSNSNASTASMTFMDSAIKLTSVSATLSGSAGRGDIRKRCPEITLALYSNCGGRSCSINHWIWIPLATLYKSR